MAFRPEGTLSWFYSRAMTVAETWNPLHPDDQCEPEWAEGLAGAYNTALFGVGKEVKMEAFEMVREMASRLPDALVKQLTMNPQIHGRGCNGDTDRAED